MVAHFKEILQRGKLGNHDVLQMLFSIGWHESKDPSIGLEELCEKLKKLIPRYKILFQPQSLYIVLQYKDLLTLSYVSKIYCWHFFMQGSLELLQFVQNCIP
jgi:hypothetical protein